MRSHWLCIPLLFASFAVAQTTTTPAATPSSTPTTAAQDSKRDPARTEPGAGLQPDTVPAPAKAPAQLPPSAPVILIKGSCPAAPAAAQTSGCKAQVTRGEFERLVKALNPEMAPALRQNFAENYGKLLVIANEARKRGIQNSAEIQVLFEFARLQVLAQELGKRIQKQASNIHPAEIESYYREHQQDFDSATAQRIIIPRPTASAEKPVDEEAEKQFAAKIRERWAAGEDPAKLQAEAYARSANKVQPPSVDLVIRRRGSAQAELPVFDLEPGEISQPILNQSAFFIYKLVKKETAPLQQVQDEIKRTLSGQRLQQEMDKITKSGEASLNQIYFGNLAAASPAGGASAPSPAGKSRVTPSQKPSTSSTPSGAKPENPNK